MSGPKPIAPSAKANGIFAIDGENSTEEESGGNGYRRSGASRRAPRADDWSETDIKTLIDCWMSGWEISAIQETLGGASYNRVALKAFRLGLPSRKRTKQFQAHDPKEDLIELAPEHPSYKFLDLDYTDEEVEAAYAPPPPVEYEYRECRNCHTLTAFASKFLRWCNSCRDEMSRIDDDSSPAGGFDSWNL